MTLESYEHSQELEALRDALKTIANEHPTSKSSNCNIFKQTYPRKHNNKQLIYRAAIDIVTTVLAKIKMTMHAHMERFLPDSVFVETLP